MIVSDGYDGKEDGSWSDSGSSRYSRSSSSASASASFSGDDEMVDEDIMEDDEMIDEHVMEEIADPFDESEFIIDEDVEDEEYFEDYNDKDEYEQHEQEQQQRLKQPIDVAPLSPPPPPDYPPPSSNEAVAAAATTTTAARTAATDNKDDSYRSESDGHLSESRLSLLSPSSNNTGGGSKRSIGKFSMHSSGGETSLISYLTGERVVFNLDEEDDDFTFVSYETGEDATTISHYSSAVDDSTHTGGMSTADDIKSINTADESLSLPSKA